MYILARASINTPMDAINAINAINAPMNEINAINAINAINVFFCINVSRSLYMCLQSSSVASRAPRSPLGLLVVLRGSS